MTPDISIIVPCFNEEVELPRCIEALDRYIATKRPGSIEVVMVDDGSSDRTWSMIKGAAETRPHWRGLRLMANRGSHIALRCACRYSTGARVVNLPVDLQEPVDNIDRLQGTMDAQQVDVVCAVRRSRADAWFERTTSRMYNRILHAVGLRNIPLEGMSQFLITRRIVDQINAHDDRGFTFEGFLAAMPLKLAVVWYDRTVVAGRVSRWTFAAKLQHALNTVLSFSNVPIRALSLLGACVALAGFLYAVSVFLRFAMLGRGANGWPSLMTVVLVIGGLNLLALGLVGEYVWRILDESRRRPLYQIEDRAGISDGSATHV
ncbi:MAG TPA: glycosyltransferase [Vicinamibacterales bacterium]|nr:glycosyltransferase [Vicinamibacterales bacterium]